MAGDTVIQDSSSTRKAKQNLPAKGSVYDITVLLYLFTAVNPAVA